VGAKADESTCKPEPDPEQEYQSAGAERKGPHHECHPRVGVLPRRSGSRVITEFRTGGARN